MQQEKIQTLFESMEIAADELKKATKAANEIRTTNQNEQKIITVIKQFNAVQANTKKLEKASIEAISRIEKQSSTLKTTTLIAVTITCALIGAVAGYTGFSSVQDQIVSHELNALKNERAKIQEQYAFINELTEKGFKVYKNAIVLPPEYSDKVGKTKDGQPAIFKE